MMKQVTHTGYEYDVTVFYNNYTNSIPITSRPIKSKTYIKIT